MAWFWNKFIIVSLCRTIVRARTAARWKYDLLHIFKPIAAQPELWCYILVERNVKTSVEIFFVWSYACRKVKDIPIFLTFFSKIYFLGGSTISRNPTDNLGPRWPGGSLSFVEIYRRTSTQTWGTQCPKKPTYNPCGNQSWTRVWKTHEQSHWRKCGRPRIFDRSFALSLQRIALELN